MPRMDKLGKLNTTVTQRNDTLTVTLYSTDVVKVTNDKIILNNGGWTTNTTKNRMNQASNQFHLDYYVQQINGVFVANYKNKTYPFVNGKVTLQR